MIELIDFINQEKLSKKIKGKTIINYFVKCIIKSLKELDHKLKNIENNHNSIISGITMIYNIFIILIFYSNNIKLTIFLVERAILLYSEFIIMSKDKKIIDEICFIPNITDAISFSYKKTIGPLSINKLNMKNDSIKDIILIIKNIVIKYYSNTDSIINIENNIHKIELKIIELFNNTSSNINLIKYIDNILNLDENININQLFIILN